MRTESGMNAGGEQQAPIRVMIVDDHAVVRGGLGTFLLAYDDLELVGEASNGLEALSVCERCQPDVVLMDLMMPEMDGATATRLLRERFPHVQVIALTSFKEEDLVQGVLAAGAIGYLLKNISADELVSAIRSARAGRPTASASRACRAPGVHPAGAHAARPALRDRLDPCLLPPRQAFVHRRGWPGAQGRDGRGGRGHRHVRDRRLRFGQPEREHRGTMGRRDRQI